MRRVLFQWQGITFFSSVTMLYCGLFVGILAQNTAAHAAKLDASRVFIATFALLAPALLGSRIFYVATHSHRFLPAHRWISNPGDGGAAMYGGLIVAFPLSVPLLDLLRVPFGAFWDAATFVILPGMIFARIGCLLNGCCAGRTCESWYGLNLPNHQGVWQKRIPTQCLEACLAAALLILAIVIWRTLSFAGELFLSVAATYAGGRIVLESTREREIGAGRLTIHHAISLAVLLASLFTLAVRHYR